MKIKKAIALMIGLVLIVSTVLPGTLAVSTGQSAASSSLTVADVTEPSAPQGTEATEATEAPTEATEAPTVSTEPEVTDPTEATKATETTLPTEPETPSFDPQAVYDQLMATKTLDEFNKLFDALSDEDVETFRAWLTENGLVEALEAHLAELETVTEPAELPIVSFTNVGPLLAAPAVHTPRAMRAAARAADDNGVVLDKTATANDDGTYTITLEAYATGASSTVVSTKPVDIVLVLDVSGSMDDPINNSYQAVYNVSSSSDYRYYVYLNGSYCQVSWNSYRGAWRYNRTSYYPKTSADDSDNSHVQFYVLGLKKIDALKSAVNSFIDSVNAKSPDSSIAIVKFAGKKINTVGNGTYRDGMYTYNYSQVVRNLTAVSSGLTSLKTAVSDLRPAGATQADYGMQHAQAIINGAANDGRKKVVIMFTDGEPTSSNGFENTVANNAISASKSIKNAGATVYTIGVFSGADGTPVNSWNGVSNTNKYMHLVSSNYKDAVSLTYTGSATYPDGGKSYFLSAGSSVELESIFTQISQEVGGSTVKLDSTSYIQDTVSGQFTIPEGTNAVSFYTMDCKGDHQFDENTKKAASGVTYTVTDNTLKVTGFDFSGNWCGPRDGVYSGKKLIVEFTVTSREDFLGGNDVLTNEGKTDGIYNSDSTSLGGFTSPSVNVPIGDVTVEATDKNVYLLGTVTADDLKNDANVKVGSVDLNLSKANDPDKPYGLEKWQIEYVDITVEIKDASGNSVTGDLTGLNDDTEYTITVTVKPKTNGTESSGAAATEKFNSGNGKINVFKPELTFKDSTAYYGESVPANNDYSDNKVGAEKWLHDDKEAVPSEMLGEKPTLDLSYTPDASRLANGTYTDQDVPVAVTVEIGEKDVTSHATFVHDKCTWNGCTWSNPTKPGDPAFLIHIQSCTLTIVKNGWETIDENQSFMFDVTDADGKLVTRVVIAMGENRSNSVTIKGLKAGTYTVKEVTEWSWRYEPQENDKSVTLSAEQNSYTVTFTNDREQNKWLGGDAYNQNKFSN